jgi:peptidoglycan-N-acetylglucosamine deacetylase
MKRPRIHPLLRTAIIAGLASGAAATVAAAAPWYFQPRTMTRAMQRKWGGGGLLFEVNTDEPVFALTFDDGPHPPYTPAVLDTLAEYDAKATFFIMGEQAERHPALYARILAEGHEVGNHFYNGRPTLMLPDEEMLASLERTEEILGGHNTGKLVRPASGFLRETERQILQDLGYRIVIGSAYTSDTTNPPRAYMRWAFKQMLEPGRIVILHDGRRNRQRTVDVLPAILEEAQRLGLRPVTISELMEHART